MVATSFASILMNDQYEYCWQTGNYEDQCCDLCPHANECSGNEHADDED